MDYQEFVSGKLSTAPATGIESGFTLPENLFPHQAALVSWALQRGRAAIFADTGLGKSRMQLAWADAVQKHTQGKVLILAPLAVAQQTVGEGLSIGVSVKHCKDGSDVQDGITITNYDRLHRFDASQFVGVVLDESSCIKHHSAKTLQTLLDAFHDTRFKLCATATPAPNDWTELGTHAEFLGVCTRAEMLAEYFTHDHDEATSPGVQPGVERSSRNGLLLLDVLTVTEALKFGRNAVHVSNPNETSPLVSLPRGRST